MVTEEWLSLGEGAGPSMLGHSHCREVPSNTSRQYTSFRYLVMEHKHNARDLRVTVAVIRLCQYKFSEICWLIFIHMLYLPGLPQPIPGLDC